MMTMIFNVIELVFGIQGTNDKVLKCRATVDAGPASIYTNAVSDFSAGTGAVVSTSEFMPIMIRLLSRVSATLALWKLRFS